MSPQRSYSQDGCGQGCEKPLPCSLLRVLSVWGYRGAPTFVGMWIWLRQAHSLSLPVSSNAPA